MKIRRSNFLEMRVLLRTLQVEVTQFRIQTEVVVDDIVCGELGSGLVCFRENICIVELILLVFEKNDSAFVADRPV